MAISKINRNDSYHKLLKDVDRLGETQSKVYECIKESRGITDQEVVERTGLTLNCVNGRRNELVDMGLVVESGSKQCLSNFGGFTMRTVWRITNEKDVIMKESMKCLSDSEMKKVEKLVRKANLFQKTIIRGWLDGQN